MKASSNPPRTRRHPYSIVDVFAERKYSGNQLAVVREAGDLSPRTMQLIARETNYSETTFVLSNRPRRGGYDVRIFTPTRELPFAGHPTIGTSFVIQQEIVKKQVPKLVLNLQYGPVEVKFEYRQSKANILWMKVENPKFGRIINPETIAAMMGVDLKDVDAKFPAQEILFGLPLVIAPLKTLAALKQLHPSPGEFEKAGITGILAFSPEPREPNNDLSARFFSKEPDIREDPATGSANAALAAYLVRHRYRGKKRINIRVDQGNEIGRPSLLRLQASKVGSRIQVQIGGRVIPTGKGELL